MPHTNFKTPEPSSFGGEDFKYISISNPKPHRRTILDFIATIYHLNKLGRGPPGMLHIKFQASEPSGTEKDDT